MAAGLGLPAPKGNPLQDVVPSPALSQLTGVAGPIVGRKIGVIADAGSDLGGITKLRATMAGFGATVHVIAPVGGVLRRGQQSVVVERTFLSARSIEFDALVMAGRTTPSSDIKAVLLQEAYRHCKVFAAWAMVRRCSPRAAFLRTGPACCSRRP